MNQNEQRAEVENDDRRRANSKRKKSKRIRGRFWCFTINNFTSTEVLKLRQLGRLLSAKGGYLCFGREGRFDGTPHLQGYLAFPRKKEFGAVKKVVSTRAHIERARGSVDDQVDYCSKEGDFEEYGVRVGPQQGRRSDLEEIRNRIEDGSSEIEVAQCNFSTWVQYRRSFQRYRSLCHNQEKRNWVTNVIVLWGPTGTGKTRRAYLHDENLYALPDTTGRWFDGYEGQDTVLIDDFDGESIKITYMLKLLDRYPMQVPIKGGFVNWKPRSVYITSNVEPDDWYMEGNFRHKDALKRRITDVVHMAVVDNQ